MENLVGLNTYTNNLKADCNHEVVVLLLLTSSTLIFMNKCVEFNKDFTFSFDIVGFT